LRGRKKRKGEKGREIDILLAQTEEKPEAQKGDEGIGKKKGGAE